MVGKDAGSFVFLGRMDGGQTDSAQPFTERLRQTQNTSINCPLLNVQTEEECLTLKRNYSSYFSDSNVLKRFDYGPKEYFLHINTVAQQNVLIVAIETQ